MITISDIKPNAEFKIKSGTVFIIHEVTVEPKYTLVTSHTATLRKGYYRNEIQDLVNFFNEEKAVKLK